MPTAGKIAQVDFQILTPASHRCLRIMQTHPVGLLEFRWIVDQAVMEQTWRDLLIGIGQRQRIQTALLAIVEQKIGVAIAGEIGAELLVVGAGSQSKPDAAAGQRAIRAAR